VEEEIEESANQVQESDEAGTYHEYRNKEKYGWSVIEYRVTINRRNLGKRTL
jgi:hypothetical protein